MKRLIIAAILAVTVSCQFLEREVPGVPQAVSQLKTAVQQILAGDFEPAPEVVNIADTVLLLEASGQEDFPDEVITLADAVKRASEGDQVVLPESVSHVVGVVEAWEKNAGRSGWQAWLDVGMAALIGVFGSGLAGKRGWQLLLTGVRDLIPFANGKEVPDLPTFTKKMYALSGAGHSSGLIDEGKAA